MGTLAFHGRARSREGEKEIERWKKRSNTLNSIVRFDVWVQCKEHRDFVAKVKANYLSFFYNKHQAGFIFELRIKYLCSHTRAFARCLLTIRLRFVQCFVLTLCLLFGFISVRLRIYNYLFGVCCWCGVAVSEIMRSCDKKNGSNNDPPVRCMCFF